ncbi:NAD-dependent epimerase/dehydratase family protein [Pendulispora albinea]|uniref:NAD-dependent epimerase/dehydratase family protein n=1 Tax=Pendulispora albinea TaxID=2741071 RepID=A0ABZ2LQ92_9BACT
MASRPDSKSGQLAPTAPSAPSYSGGQPGGRRSPVTKGPVVALTGAASFLGTNVIGLLEEDERIARIVAIDIKPPSTAGKKTRSYEVDFTQPTAEARLGEVLAAERADILVHLAFLSSPTTASAWAHELESVGTMHVLVAARHAQVRKVVMWSQTLLYGAHPSNPNFLSERHPLRADRHEPFFSDKVEAEAEASKFARRAPGSVVTILRMAPILGPTVHNYMTRYLAHRMVPTMMGFDPLLQFIHEVDAIAAIKLAIDRDVPGTFNIVGDGVLPLSTVIKLAGRIALPIPHPVAESICALGWLAQVADVPPTFLKYLRFLCVADGTKAQKEMGFRPAYTTREALLDFVSAQRLRDVKLLQENVA